MSDAPLILYVDDERGNRVVFEQSFGARFRVKAVASGPEALEVLEREVVAVVVTDQRMPEMSGDDLLRAVKERHPQVVRAVITAYADVEPILAAINDGLVSRYVIKPWDRAELEQLLRWGVEAWQLARDSAALSRRLHETERLATLGSSVGAVIHDLNQPLIGLLMNGDRLVELSDTVPLLRRALGGEPMGAVQRASLNALLDELPEIADEMRQSVELLRDMTGRFSPFLRNRPSRGDATADPVAVIRHAIGMCQDIAVRARGAIVYDGPTELPRVRADATDVTQVLINLVANAAHALLARDRSGGRVSVLAHAEDQILRFEVKDDGVGMSPDVLAKVGTPFFTTRAEGTGLGISQCQRLVGRAGGTFRIDSQEGVGTIVSFTLPRA
jgi:two-component system response regulator PhcR